MECNCLAEPCNNVDGICPLGGCKEGWHGDSCSKRCGKGKFGRNCIDSCDGCISNSCDAIDGLCYNTTGCEPGYYFEEYCNNTCDDCFFGTNCSRKCNCLQGPCNWFTGMCPPGGCEKGWQGESCDKGCGEGKFGQNCNDSCDGCISNSCDAIDGLCYNTTGCEPGYYFEEYCNNICDDYYFGNNCTKQCHCLEKPCNNDDGICSPEGCKEGWHGKSCDQACDDWYFGNNCAWKCYCLTGPCNLLTGKCPPGGCQKGWHGVACEVSTVTAENKPLMSTHLGLFIGGFLLGILMATTACFLARKRRKLTKKQGKETVTENHRGI
ncbi:Hypothetical predicted protein [Mytilus galloprovincialis]|uniref:Uncharacterized protein n=1 Tax=Mytilus galloprovincialis TaxID=29158 RepID=A0A8B6DE97_MYTGA|nr:Hypothetical predicted protein [Mytilus galloprovincialis]